MIRLALMGAGGRMGQQIQKLLSENARFQKKYKLVFQASRVEDTTQALIKKSKASLVIDFSSPSNCIAIASICSSLKIPLFTGTTGFTSKELGQLKRLMKKTKWIQVPNTSLGVRMLSETIKSINPFLNSSDYSIEILDIHHIHKKDAPSGTAKKLLSCFEPKVQKRVKIISKRIGEVVGTHTVTLKNDYEIITLKHEATTRELFAYGALLMAQEFTRTLK